MRKFLYLFLSVQKDLIVGGQAVMEGVMMRTPSAYAIAVRKKDGSIVHTAETLPKWSDTYKWLNLPILRGGATLIQSMALGVKALNFSANVALEEAETLEAAEKVKNLQTEPALVDGTMNENFTKARVKVIMPEKEKASFKELAIREIISSLDTVSFHNKARYIKYFSGDRLPNNAFFLSYQRYDSKKNDMKREMEEKFAGDFKNYFSYVKQKYQ